MLLNLTEDEKNNISISFNSNRFFVQFGENSTMSREYNSVSDMLKEFKENGIDKADFDVCLSRE